MLGARIPVGLRNSNNSRQNAGIKTAKPFYRVYLGILALLCYRTRNCSAISFFSISRAVFRAVVFWRLAVGGCSFRTLNLIIPGVGGKPSSGGVLARWWGSFVGIEKSLNYYFSFLLSLPLALFNSYNALCRMVIKHSHIMASIAPQAR